MHKLKQKIEASNKKAVKKIKDNKDNRQMTDEEYEEFIENIGGEERLEALILMELLVVEKKL